MLLQDELQNVVEAVASNPKLSTTVSAVTATLGTAWYADAIHGIGAAIAITVGILSTIALIRVHLKTSEKLTLENKILRHQAKALGIDLTKDEL